MSWEKVKQECREAKVQAMKGGEVVIIDQKKKIRTDRSPVEEARHLEQVPVISLKG